MSHNVEKWREILSEFQDAWADNDGAWLVLYAVTWLERSGTANTDGQPWVQVGELIGNVPIDDENGYAIVAPGPHEGRNPFAEVTRQAIADGLPILDLHNAARKRFEELASIAGAALPRSIRDAIPVAPHNAHSWWLATMWWSKPPSQQELNERGYRAIWCSPFEDSIETIERCNLVSDNPSLRGDERTADKSALVVAATSSSTKHSYKQQHGQPEDDPIEDTLSGQKLHLYRFLKQRSRRVSFDSLAELKECWRGDSPLDGAIEKGLKRLQSALNQIEGCPVALVIEAQHRRVRLDK